MHIKTRGNSQHTMVGDSIRLATHTIDELGESAAQTADNYVRKGRRVVSDLKKEAAVYGDTAIDYVRENPVKSTLIAAAVGFVLSRILR